MANPTKITDRIEALRKQAVTDRDTVDKIVARWADIDPDQLRSDALAEGARLDEIHRCIGRINATLADLRISTDDANEHLHRVRDHLALLSGLVDEARANRRH